MASMPGLLEWRACCGSVPSPCCSLRDPCCFPSPAHSPRRGHHSLGVCMNARPSRLDLSSSSSLYPAPLNTGAARVARCVSHHHHQQPVGGLGGSAAKRLTAEAAGNQVTAEAQNGAAVSAATSPTAPAAASAPTATVHDVRRQRTRPDADPHHTANAAAAATASNGTRTSTGGSERRGSSSSSTESTIAVVNGSVNGSLNGSIYGTSSTSASDIRSSGSSGSGIGGQLIENGMVYRERFVIRCYEVGVNRRASMETIANLLQEIACNHAKSVGFSNDGFATTPAMQRKRLIWVTTRMHIEIDEYPEWGDEVEIDTWFQSESSILSRRDWIIRIPAQDNKIIGRGTSSWVMMNADTRRMSRIPEDVRKEFILHCADPPRFSFPPPDGTEGKSGSSRVGARLHSTAQEKIPRFDEPPEHVRSNLSARRSDLDMNRHVNNVTYIAWMLESLPQELLSSAELAQITLEYRRECVIGDTVESLARSLPTSSSGIPMQPKVAAVAAALTAAAAAAVAAASVTGAGGKAQHTLQIPLPANVCCKSGPEEEQDLAPVGAAVAAAGGSSAVAGLATCCSADGLPAASARAVGAGGNHLLGLAKGHSHRGSSELILQYVHVLRLQQQDGGSGSSNGEDSDGSGGGSGGKEINKGRTVWRLRRDQSKF